MKRRSENSADNLSTIRLFISSTFSDMQAERDCFNSNLVPKLRTLCRDRGVSFFSVDLRWGITSEDIANERLIPLCLKEVDKCRPFFLGIIGSRYGSQIESIPESLLEPYPWLPEKIGASYTELEITYHFLKNENPRNGLFLFKKCAESEDADEQQALQRLKDVIRKAAPDRIREYESLEEFREIILQEFDVWLKELYGSTDIHLQRALLFARENDRHPAKNTAEENSIYKCIRDTSASVMLHGEGPLGKTALLNDVAKRFPHAIVVNCHADEANIHWPYVAHSIYRQLENEPEIHIGEGQWFQTNNRANIPGAVLSSAEEEQIKSEFLKMLASIQCENDTILVINDLEYIQGNQTKYLQWLPGETVPKFRIVCSTNDPDILNSAEIMGWNLVNVHPMPPKAAEAILTAELEQIGKNAKDAHALLRSPLAGYPGYVKTAIDFLNAFGAHDTIAALSETLAEADSFPAFYACIFAHIEARYGSTFRRDLRLVLAAMSLSELPLEEAGCYYVLFSIHRAEKARWSGISDVLGALRFLHSNGVPSETLRNYILNTLTAKEAVLIHDALGNYRLSVADIRNVKAALIHFSHSKNVVSILHVLSDARTVKALCIHDSDCVRRALSVLLFHSDRNVGKCITGWMTEWINQAEDGDEQLSFALLQLRTIHKDLNLVKEQNRIEQLTELALQRGILSLPDVQMNVMYDMMHAMALDAAANGRAEEALSLLEQHLQSPATSPEGKAQYSIIKANLKLKFRHTDMLGEIEEAIRLSVKAASVSCILAAYDLKVTALVWKREYGQALALADMAEQWSQDLGYVFYTLAYVQQKIVCLYRTKKFDQAIQESQKYNALCLRWGCTEHAVVMQRNIALTLNLAERYSECIQHTTQCLKGKKLSSANRLELLAILKAAYFNTKQFEKSLQTIKLALQESALTESKSIMLLLSSAVAWMMKDESSLPKALADLQRAFELLLKRGNREAICYCLHSFFPVLSADSQGIAFWQKWKDQLGDDMLFYRQAADSTDEMLNGSFFTAVIHSQGAQHNISKLEDTYRIACERGQYCQAGDAACKLAQIHRQSVPGRSAAYYLQSLQAYKAAGNTEKGTETALQALDVLFEQGRVTDPVLHQGVRDSLDAESQALLTMWEQAGDALTEYSVQETAIKLLTGIVSNKHVRKQLILSCIADLSALIATKLSPDTIDELASAAHRNGIADSLFLRLISASLGDWFAQREAVYGEKRIAEIKKTDPDFASILAASPYFELAGGMDQKKMFPQTSNGEDVGAQCYVVPKYKCKHLDHVFASVTRAPWAEGYLLMCLTDIVFRSMPPALETAVQNYISAQTQTDTCRLILLPNKSVKCEAFLRGANPTSIAATYAAHTRYLDTVIRELDALAGQFAS